MSFPVTPDEVTAAWLTEQLRRPIVAVRCERFAEGVGVIGQVVRLRLSEGDGSTSSMIAKFPAPNAATRDLAIGYDMYGREVRFYKHLSERIPLRVPRCYAAEYDAGNHAFVLLLEDLGRMRIGDQIVGATLKEATTLISQLAAMQAKFWDLRPGAAGTEWLPVHNNPAQLAGMQTGVNMGWPVVRASMPDEIPAAALAHVDRLHDNIPRLLSELCRAPMALTHCDVRLDNVFMDGDAIALVDWQSVCISAPEQDVAYFITQSLTHELRRAHGDALLRHYHAELVRNGVQGYSFDECFARYRYAALYMACFAITIAGTLDMGNERGNRLARALLGRSLHGIAELDGYRLLA